VFGGLSDSANEVYEVTIRKNCCSQSIWPGRYSFAIEGATAAISGNLDVLGMMILPFATALGGGIIAIC
jgi:Glycine transporter